MGTRVVSQSGFILPKSLFVGACRRLIAGLVLDAAFLWLPSVLLVQRAKRREEGDGRQGERENPGGDKVILRPLAGLRDSAWLAFRA